MLVAVIRDGNSWEGEGSSGLDTVYLVEADSIESAAQTVDQRLLADPDEGIQNHCMRLFVIANREEGAIQNTRILMGPLYGFTWTRSERNMFSREDEDGPWINYDSVE
jgi:hypothetical protein